MLSTQNRTQARNRASVSSHPLFPAIVALWFGALFGLGSLAVRPSIFESLVLSSHLDVILPMAAPPLGMTARILLATTMAVIGIATGAVIARRIARPKPVARPRRRGAGNRFGKTRGRAENTFSTTPQRQQEPEIAPEVAPAGRRRALAIEHEERDDYRLQAAPLPGGSPSIFDVTQIDMADPEEAAAQVAAPEPAVHAEEPQPLELSGFAEPEQSPAELFSAQDVALPETDNCLVLDEPVEAPAQRQVFGQPQPASVEESTPIAPVAAPALDDSAITAFEPQSQLGRFSAPADANPVSAPEAQPPASQPSPGAGLVLPQDSAAQRITSADLAELSPVELIERFALALQQRRPSGALPTGLVEAAASFAAPEPAPFAAQAPAMTPEPVDAPQMPAISTGFGETEADDDRVYPTASPLSLPTALRPIDFSEYEDHDDHHSFVPPRSISMPRSCPIRGTAS